MIQYYNMDFSNFNILNGLNYNAKNPTFQRYRNYVNTAQQQMLNNVIDGYTGANNTIWTPTVNAETKQTWATSGQFIIATGNGYFAMNVGKQQSGIAPGYNLFGRFCIGTTTSTSIDAFNKNIVNETPKNTYNDCVVYIDLKSVSEHAEVSSSNYEFVKLSDFNINNEQLFAKINKTNKTKYSELIDGLDPNEYVYINSVRVYARKPTGTRVSAVGYPCLVSYFNTAAFYNSDNDSIDYLDGNGYFTYSFYDAVNGSTPSVKDFSYNVIFPESSNIYYWGNNLNDGEEVNILGRFNRAYAIHKKSDLITYLNEIGIPWTTSLEEATNTPADEFTTGYIPDYEPPDPPPEPGQPDNESGGGDGDGDNVDDPFDLPTPTLNPASAAVNQYILNSNQVYNFMEELFNGTFWTNSDLLNKNPKESVVSLTAWPINLLNWDTRHVGTSTPIQCGNVTMQYASGQPIQNGYNKIIDIGEYEIKPYFGSFMDYLTKIEIFLPFIGWRNLSTQNVMGRTIKVKYVLNFEDGGIVVYITSTDGKIERLEQVEQAKLAFDLPIFTSNINEKEKDKLQLLMTAAVSAVTAGVGAFGAGAGGVATAAGTAAGKEVVSGATKISAWQDNINGGSVVASNATWYLPNKCILKFTRPRKSEPSGYGRVNGYPANYTAKLGDVTGYTEVDNPIINGIECTEIERQKIKTLLQGGIYL